MPKNQKQKKTVPLSNEIPDREVVLDALQNVSVLEKPKVKKVSNLPAKRSHQVTPLVVGGPTKQQTEFKEEKKETKPISLKDPKKVDVLKNTKYRDRYWIKTIPFFVIIFILFGICFLQTGLYFQPSIRPISEKIASAIHYPIAVVGTHIVAFADFKSERDLLEVYSEKGFSFSSDERSIKRLALNKIIRDTYLHAGEKQFGVRILDSTIEQAFVNLFGAESNSQDAYVISTLTLGLTPGEIKEQIIKPYIEKLEFSKALLNDANLIQRQKSVAEQLKINFSKEPNSFSDKKTYPFLGVTFYDLGYLQSSSLVGKYSIIADLETGEVSDVFEDAEAFSLFRVIEKLPQESESQSQYLSLQKIEIKKINADLWIDSKLQSSRVAIFDPTVIWNSSCRQVTEGVACLGLSSQNSSVSLDSLYEVLMGDSSIFSPNFTNN